MDGNPAAVLWKQAAQDSEVWSTTDPLWFFGQMTPEAAVVPFCS